MTEKGCKTGDRMTDERKDRTEAIEQLPPEELAKEIEKNKRKVARNIVFIMAAMVAFIAICIAWFVSNNRVNGILGGISAKKSGIEIGSKGSGGVHDDLLQKIAEGIKYHLPESGDEGKHNTSQGGSINWLLGKDSNMKNYDKNYDDGNAFKETEGKFRKDYAMEPGTKGKLDFFIKSYEGGNLSLNFTLDIAPYIMNGETAQPEAVKKDSAAAQLLSGHILYFLGEKQSDETIKYTWIKGGTFKIEIKDAQADTKYDYSIYWVWPLNLSTILLNKEDELLNGNAVEFDDKDPALRNEIITDMEGHPEKYFFNSLTGKPLDTTYAEVGAIKEIHEKSGENGTYNKQLFVDLSSYYNQADMKIGSEISFIRATLEYTGPSETTTKTTEANNEG